MKKSVVLLLLITLTLSMLSACADTKGTPKDMETQMPEENQPVSETVSFTDSAGRVVEVPAVINKIAVSGPLAQIVLFALAPDKFVGIATEWDKTAAEYFDPKYYALPVIGQLYGTKGELNLEELMKASPDLVIDVGEPKDGIAQDMDDLQERTGIPFVHISAFTETMGETYRTLGKLLNMETEAERLASYCDGLYSSTLDLMKTVGEDNRVSLLYCLGDEGLNVSARGAYHAEVLDLMSDNVAVLDNPSSKGTGNEVDMEQLLLWNPSVIVFAPDSVYDSVGTDETWLQLSAISGGTYYEAPFGPYNWLGFPSSVQRYLGMLWLGNLLYPDKAEYDLYEKVAEYYELFYHCALSQEQFDKITENSK